MLIRKTREGTTKDNTTDTQHHKRQQTIDLISVEWIKRASPKAKTKHNRPFYSSKTRQQTNITKHDPQNTHFVSFSFPKPSFFSFLFTQTFLFRLLRPRGQASLWFGALAVCHSSSNRMDSHRGSMTPRRTVGSKEGRKKGGTDKSDKCNPHTNPNLYPNPLTV